MSKDIAKAKKKIVANIEQIEDLDALNGILNYTTYAVGSTGAVESDDAGDDDKKGKKDKKKGKKDDAKPEAANDVDLSGIKPKKLKAIAVAAGLDVDAADNDAITEALSQLTEKKLRKAAATAEVELPDAE